MSESRVKRGDGQRPKAVAYPLEPIRGIAEEDLIYPHTQGTAMSEPNALDAMRARLRAAFPEHIAPQFALFDVEPQMQLRVVPTKSIVRRSFAPRTITRAMVAQVRSIGIPTPVSVLRQSDGTLMVLDGDEWVGAAQQVLAGGGDVDLEHTTVVEMPPIPALVQYLIVLALEKPGGWVGADLVGRVLCDPGFGLSQNELAEICGHTGGGTISERLKVYTRVLVVLKQRDWTEADEQLLAQLPHDALKLSVGQGGLECWSRYLRVAITAVAAGEKATPAVKAAIIRDGRSLTRRRQSMVPAPDAAEQRFGMRGSVAEGELLFLMYEREAPVAPADAAYGIRMLLPVLLDLMSVVGIDEVTRLKMAASFDACIDRALRKAVSRPDARMTTLRRSSRALCQ